MRALIVQHVAHEGPAAFAGPIRRRGYAIERIEAGRGDPIDWHEPDLLVLMGGPMAVYEQDRHPWIAEEIAGIARRIAAGRPTLGVCLGAQLIAAALGGTVAPGPVRELGFAPLVLTEAGRRSPLRLLDGLPVLHWHGDGFTVPEEAVLLADTAHYPQAFALGGTVLALQCHPEMGGPDDGIAAWLAADAAYVEGAGTTAEAIRADHARFGAAAAVAAVQMLDDWLAGLQESRDAIAAKHRAPPAS